MRHYAILFVLFALLFQPAQATPIDRVIKRYKALNGVTYVKAPKEALLQAQETGNETERELVKKTKEAHLLMMLDCPEDTYEQFEADIAGLTEKGYEAIAQEPDEDVQKNVLVRKKGESIREIVVAITMEEIHFLVVLKGDFPSEKLQQAVKLIKVKHERN